LTTLPVLIVLSAAAGKTTLRISLTLTVFPFFFITDHLLAYQLQHQNQSSCFRSEFHEQQQQQDSQNNSEKCAFALKNLKLKT
jgi:hypothetical protein